MELLQATLTCLSTSATAEEKKDVVTAIHHSLGDVDTPSGHIAIGVDVGHAINRHGMDAHA
jgi:hypothetical protein